MTRPALSEGRGPGHFNNWDRTANFEADARQSVDDIARLRATHRRQRPRSVRSLAQWHRQTAERMAFQARTSSAGPVTAQANAAVCSSSAERQAQLDDAGGDQTRAAKRFGRRSGACLDQRRRAARRAGSWEVWGALIGLATGKRCLLHPRPVAAGSATGRDRRHVAELSRLNERLERMTQNLIKARDAAERSNRARRRTSSPGIEPRAAHRPLNGILGYTRLLSMEGGLNSTAGHAGGCHAGGAGRHLLHMISRVLDPVGNRGGERLELQNEVDRCACRGRAAAASTWCARTRSGSDWR